MKSKQVNDVEKQRDPEELWKLNPNPWEKWGFESMDKINSKDDVIDSKEELPRKYSFFRHIRMQFIVSIILFVIVVSLGQISNENIQEGKRWLGQELSQSFDFVAMANYYQQFFAGSPSFIPSFGNRSEQVLARQHELVEMESPLRAASIVQTFGDKFNGIELMGDKSGEVIAVEKGRVILVRDQQDSIIIQHANNRISIYAKLEKVFVNVNDWVEAGTVIGKLPDQDEDTASTLFFALKQNDQYIDPLEVIPIE